MQSLCYVSAYQSSLGHQRQRMNPNWPLSWTPGWVRDIPVPHAVTLLCKCLPKFTWAPKTEKKIRVQHPICLETFLVHAEHPCMLLTAGADRPRGLVKTFHFKLPQGRRCQQKDGGIDQRQVTKICPRWTMMHHKDQSKDHRMIKEMSRSTVSLEGQYVFDFAFLWG